MFEQIRIRAERQTEAGNWAAARDEWLAALDIAADPAVVMLELSYVESLAGHYRAARDWALRAAQACPRSDEAMLSLVHRLRTFNEGRVLHDIVVRMPDPGRTHPRVLVECARQLSNLNDFGLAIRCAEAAVRAEPNDLSARLVRGQLHAHYGRTDDARADFEWTLQRNPRVAQAWWLLARLRSHTTQSNHVAQLRALLREPGRSPPDVAALARALHKELDDLGEHSSAWEALALMCRAKRYSEAYDARRHRALVDALVGLPAPGAKDARLVPAGRTPVFIVGMYRSGTTLLEQLLDASPAVRGLGEVNDFASAMRYATDHYSRDVIDRAMVERATEIELEDVGKRYLEGIEWRLGFEPVFTDKLPANFLNIGFICRALPHAKILHAVRDPLETCFSNLRELFTGINAFSYDQQSLADYFIQYRRLMAHWHAAYPGRILDVDYAELTRDPASVMRQVAAFCGIDYNDAMSDPRSSTRAVSTASAVQVRDRVVRREVPKWAPYARQLQPLITALRQGGVEVPELPA